VARQLLDVLVPHRAVDENALAGRAALTGAQVARGLASTAASRSASSMTTSGPMPPISSSAAWPAAACPTSRPVAVEPMNAIPSGTGIARDLVTDRGRGA
jgi:hypothetical protein